MFKFVLVFDSTYLDQSTASPSSLRIPRENEAQAVFSDRWDVLRFRHDAELHAASYFLESFSIIAYKIMERVQDRFEDLLRVGDIGLE